MIWPGAWNGKTNRFWDTVQQAPGRAKNRRYAFGRNEKAGFTQVEKDKIRVDAWEFKKL